MTRAAVVATALLGLAGLMPPPSGLETPRVRPRPAAEAAPARQGVADPAAEARRRVAGWLHERDRGLLPAEIPAVADALVRAARREGLAPELVLAVIEVESGGDPFAVSSAGALGLMQLLPPTGRAVARDLGLPWRGPATLFDPVVNVELGTAYLGRLARRFDDVDRALAAYNWGPTRIARRLAGGVPLPEGYPRRVRTAFEATPGARWL